MSAHTDSCSESQPPKPPEERGHLTEHLTLTCGENPPQARGGVIPDLNTAVPAAAGLTRLTRLIVLAGANR